MEPMKLPAGYRLPPGKTMTDVRRLDEELLAGEDSWDQDPKAKDGKRKDSSKRK
jgi:hypothetical protein